MVNRCDKRYLAFILYPASPLEVLYNAEEHIVTESYVDKVADNYVGNDILKYTDDDDGIEVRKYGRIVFREFAE